MSQNESHNEKLTQLFLKAIECGFTGNVEDGHAAMDEYDKLAGHSSRPSTEENPSDDKGETKA